MNITKKSQPNEQDPWVEQFFVWNHIEVSSHSEREDLFGQQRHYQQPLKMVYQITQEDIKKQFQDNMIVQNRASFIDQVKSRSIYDDCRENAQSKKNNIIFSNVSSSWERKNSVQSNANPFNNTGQIPSKQEIKQKNQFDDVFREYKRKKKNTNFPKILVSNFEKYIRNTGIQITRQHSVLLSRAKKLYTQKGIRNIKMQALQTLFGESQLGQLFTRQNRQILFSLLGSIDFKIESIFQSRSMKGKNRRQHLLAAKVYRLRCRSRKLTGRVQSK